MLKIQVILGSTRQARFGDKPAKWITEEAGKRAGWKVELLDLRNWPLPFYDEVAGAVALDGKFSHEEAVRWAAKVAEADAFIIATPEYDHGYSAVLKNALDYGYLGFNNKPVAFVAWGSVGGARAVEQLRQVAIELQMAPIRNAVHIFEPWNMIDEQGRLKTASFEKSAGPMFDQLDWWAKALKAAREKS